MPQTRRYFLKTGGVALAGFAAAPSFLIRTALAQTNANAGSDRPILVVLFQRGAADGISMVVPFGDKSYHAARPQIGIPAPSSQTAESAIDLDGFYGLHPSLDALKPLYDSGHLAVVHAVGSPDNTRSHFDAQDYMESGTPGTKSMPDGWLNRYLQSTPVRNASPFRAVAIDSTMPRTLSGSAPGVAMERASEFGIRGGRASAEIEEMFADLYKETFDAVKLLRRVNPQQYTPASGVKYSNSAFGQALLQIAQLVKSGIGLQVAFADIGGWDTHSNQGNTRGQLANRLRDFGDSIGAFYYDLGDRMRNVVVVTMTEFGRAVRQNGSGGTDHGHASCLFVAGGPVKGGKVYGKWPGLAPDQLHEGRDLAVTTDFRDIFTEVLQKHMTATDVERIFPGFKPAKNYGVV